MRAHRPIVEFGVLPLRTSIVRIAYESYSTEYANAKKYLKINILVGFGFGFA